MNSSGESDDDDESEGQMGKKVMPAANNYQPGDRNRSENDPDSLVKGVEDYMIDAQAREGLYNFIALYVQKVCPDSLITKYLRAMPRSDSAKQCGLCSNQPTEEWERYVGYGN